MASIRLAERFGCRVCLLNVTGQVHRILQVSQLLPLLSVHENENAALVELGATADEQAALAAVASDVPAS